MIRRPPRSTLFPYTDALPISGELVLQIVHKFVRVIAQENGANAPVAAGHEDRPKGAFPDGESDFCVDRKSTRLNSSHVRRSYADFRLEKKPHSVSTSTHSLVN